MDSHVASTAEDVTGVFCVFYNGPFSDFFSSTFVVEGISYASVEHYFQIQMLRSFGLFKLASKLSTIFDANVFRRVLRRNLRTLVENGLFDERMFGSWRSTNALRLLRKSNRAKFEQNFDIKKHLLETGDRILVFTNKHDRLFGVGMDELAFLDWALLQNWKIEELLDCFSSKDLSETGVLGQNLLGFCLMELRAELSNSPSSLAIWKQQLHERKGATIEDNGANDSPTVEIENSAGSEVDDGLDSSITEDQILANLTSAEASLALEKDALNECTDDGPPPSTSAVIFRVPNEKRIVYRKPGFVQRVIGGAGVGDLAQKPLTSTNSSIINGEQCEIVHASTANALDKRRTVLERLKALAFQKPMINPFVNVINRNRSPFEALSNSTCQLDNDGVRWKIPRLCDLPPIQLPLRNDRHIIGYPQLEPGEIPSGDYRPVIMPAERSNYCGTYFAEEPAELAPTTCQSPTQRCDSVGIEQVQNASSANFCQRQQELAQPSDSSTETLWTPSSNPMKDVFESAKAGIKKLVETVKKGQTRDEDMSRLLLLRPPPIKSKPDARRRKCTADKAAPSYAGILYNSKDAQIRHLANRWVKGGRLTTTGEFEECHSDDEDEDGSKAASKSVECTLRQLEVLPASMDGQVEEKPARPVQLHIVYEDTAEYSDYVKWYGDVHGCSPSDVVDDEYQQYLRQWYRWYQTAVKFVDVEPLSDDEQTNADEMSSEEQSKMLMQQWRWQQINEWESKTRANTPALTIAHETHTDGVSFSGKPVTYSA